MAVHLLQNRLATGLLQLLSSMIGIAKPCSRGEGLVVHRIEVPLEELPQLSILFFKHSNAVLHGGSSRRVWRSPHGILTCR
jgi:hypothetical protein